MVGSDGRGPCHTQPVNLRKTAIPAVLFVFLSSVPLVSQDAKATGEVTPNLAEFRIPLEQAADATWNWNRAETPDNGGEYIWQVSIRNGSGSYSFGFFLYKLPGSKPEHGDLQALFKAGQASVFQENAEGKGDLMQNAEVNVSAEGGKVVIRIADPGLIHTIFGSHPDTATVRSTALGSNFEVVKIQYRK